MMEVGDEFTVCGGGMTWKSGASPQCTQLAAYVNNQILLFLLILLVLLSTRLPSSLCQRNPVSPHLIHCSYSP